MAKKQMGRGVTATDVARRAGVSQSTVSRVFSPQQDQPMRESTRERVLAAAQELGYIPNAMAQTMASGRSRIIGVVTPDSYNLFHYHLLQLLVSTFRAHHLRTMVFTSKPTDQINELLESLYRYQVDGVIVTSAALGQRVTGSWRKKGMPVILLNSDLPDAEVSMVQSNHYGSGVLMAEHLLSAGYRRFAYVSAAKSPHLNLLSRQEGFLSGLAAHSVHDCQVVPAAYSYQSGLEAGRFLLAQDKPPEAIFCGGDVNGFGVIDAIRADGRFRLGTDIGVAGYDAPIIDAFQGYSMTALAQPCEQLAEDAAELLLEMVDGPAISCRKIVRPMRLIVRSTTCRCPETAQ